MSSPAESRSALILDAATAQELMTPNPVALRADASIRDAVALLTDKGVSAAPVIDVAGRPVGVLSDSDIVVHERTPAVIWTRGSANYLVDASGRVLGPTLAGSAHVPQ